MEILQYMIRNILMTILKYRIKNMLYIRNILMEILQYMIREIFWPTAAELTEKWLIAHFTHFSTSFHPLVKKKKI